MTSPVSMPNSGATTPGRAANLLGALSLAVVDRLATGSAPAAGSLTRSAALVLLDDVPGCSIEWLARRLELSHSATVRLVDRLVADGLVRRRRGPDGRTAALDLSSDGTRAMREVRERRADRLRAFVDRLDDAQRTSLVALAETLLYPLVTEPGAEWRVCRLCDFSACVDPCCPVLDAVGDLKEDS